MLLIKQLELLFTTNEDKVKEHSKFIQEVSSDLKSIFFWLRILLRKNEEHFLRAYVGCDLSHSLQEVHSRLRKSTFKNATDELGIEFSIFDTREEKLNMIKNYLRGTDRSYTSELHDIMEIAEFNAILSRERAEKERLEFAEKMHKIYAEFIFRHNIENTEQIYEEFLIYGHPYLERDEPEVDCDDSDFDLDEFLQDYSCLSCGSNTGCYCRGGN